MTNEQFVNKYGKPFFESNKLGSFYTDVAKLNSERIKALEAQLKETKEFAIWMTGCHDFTQYDWFIRQRDKLRKSKSDA